MHVEALLPSLVPLGLRLGLGGLLPVGLVDLGHLRHASPALLPIIARRNPLPLHPYAVLRGAAEAHVSGGLREGPLGGGPGVVSGV